MNYGKDNHLNLGQDNFHSVLISKEHNTKRKGIKSFTRRKIDYGKMTLIIERLKYSKAQLFLAFFFGEILSHSLEKLTFCVTEIFFRKKLFFSQNFCFFAKKNSPKTED